MHLYAGHQNWALFTYFANLALILWMHSLYENIFACILIEVANF